MIRDYRLAQFMAIYTPCLAETLEKYPNEYAWPKADVPVVAARVREAIRNGTYNHDGRAIKATCKKLGIKHTRKAIQAFLETL